MGSSHVLTTCGGEHAVGGASVEGNGNGGFHPEAVVPSQGSERERPLGSMGSARLHTVLLHESLGKPINKMCILPPCLNSIL